MNKITKLENGNYQLETENGNVYPCSRWFEKKTNSWHVKLTKEGSEETGRTYIRESKIVNGIYEFETKTEHREGLSYGGWKSKLTEEEKVELETYEKGIERLKEIASKREVKKVDPNSEEGLMLAIAKYQAKLAKMRGEA
jgi:hypothetical protein